MNNQTTGRSPARNSPIQMKVTAQILNESADYLKKIKRSIEEFRAFNRKAQEYVDNLKIGHIGYVN